MRRALFAAAALTLVALATPLVAADPPGAVQLIHRNDQIEFRLGDALVTRYHLGEKVAKPFFWPLNAPGDVPVTRAWPMGEVDKTKDHVHQKSAWFCHGDVIPEGVELPRKVKGVEGVDFWSEHANAGKIVCVEVGALKIEPKHGHVRTRNEWRTADGVKILDETRTIHLHDLGDARLLVLDIDLHASVCPILFGDTKEGSMGVRVSDQLAASTGNGTLTNADGAAGEKSVWGMLSKWCDYSGTVDGKPVGIAVFDDPENPVPAAWHSRGYGLMAANPFGRAKSGFPSQKDKPALVKLAKGEHLTLRYGLLLHAGDAKSGRVAEHFETFAKLPR